MINRKEFSRRAWEKTFLLEGVFQKSTKPQDFEIQYHFLFQMEAAKSLGHVSSKKLPAPTSSHRSSSSGTSTNSLRLNPANLRFNMMTKPQQF